MNNIKDTLIDMIGPYEPVATTSVSVSIDESSISLDGIGSLDMPWIFSALLIIIAFSGILALLRALVSGLQR